MTDTPRSAVCCLEADCPGGDGLSRAGWVGVLSGGVGLKSGCAAYSWWAGVSENSSMELAVI